MKTAEGISSIEEGSDLEDERAEVGHLVRSFEKEV
jgi:hypothetical protein